MITNKQTKVILTGFAEMLYFGSETRSPSTLRPIYERLLECIDAIPDEEEVPEREEVGHLSTEDLEHVIKSMENQPENKTGKFNYYEKDNNLHMDIGDLGKMRWGDGAITATATEAEAYKYYVDYLPPHGQAITFGEWLKNDRAARRKEVNLPILSPTNTKGGPDRISAREQDKLDKAERKRKFREALDKPKGDLDIEHD